MEVAVEVEDLEIRVDEATGGDSILQVFFTKKVGAN